MAEQLNYSKGSKRIYIIGPCIVGGAFCATEHTFATCLQNCVPEEYSVVRFFVPYHTLGLLLQIEKLPIKKGDIVCIVAEESLLTHISDIPRLVMTDKCKEKRSKAWFVEGRSIHTTPEGNRVLSEYLYTNLLSDVISNLNYIDDNSVWLNKGEILSDDMQSEVKAYTKSIRFGDMKEDYYVGAIVMNCNPFTYGHQYLVEYAADKVDLLYIFVVQEDRSVFKFSDRLEMVRRGTEHLGNVNVVPSGEWVLSYDTLPIYFEKSEKREEKVDARMDLEIFARYVAPELGIKKRFVGSEPEDKITNQYNEQMVEILNEFDIDVEVVPRKICGDKVISASYVRKCIESKEYKEIEKYVPESTIEIIGAY